ncbi:MAG TPA: ATP-binding protein [Ktedonobacteraceae bacterium]|nr:ATP-binding protein [Ktedonobacteraceae bacterium]
MLTQLESVFDTLPESIIVCDRAGKILRINAAARKLFEVTDESLYRGKNCRQLLHDYAIDIDSRQQPVISLEPWLLSLVQDEEMEHSLQEEIIVFNVPSGRRVYATIYCLPALDRQKQAVATLYVFHDITHRYLKALHLQRVHQAQLRLKDAITCIPDDIDFVFSEEIFLLSPPVLYVTQQLVDLVCQILKSQNVCLLALGSQAGYLYYAVGSGFTAEQEQYHREVSGSFLPSDFVGDTVLARLAANQAVVLPGDHIHLPPGFKNDMSMNNFLLVPMILEDQMSGILGITRAGLSSEYSPGEIEFVKTVAQETLLVIACLRYAHERSESWARLSAQQELHRLIDEFLNLASHELKTSLTVIKGNIQLAQRRLAMLKRQLAEQPRHAGENIERMQDDLAYAEGGTHLQERLIKDILDAEHIQSNTLELHLRRCDLAALLKQTVAEQQREARGRAIVLDIAPEEAVVPVHADAERIKRVINGYLTNALNYSPIAKPVTVRLTVEHALARVSVHDEGPGIPLEEQGPIWERFCFVKKIAARQWDDQGFGLGLYLCKAFIERHHGSVGVQSEPGHGATFWFTLPVAASAQGE